MVNLKVLVSWAAKSIRAFSKAFPQISMSRAPVIILIDPAVLLAKLKLPPFMAGQTFAPTP